MFELIVIPGLPDQETPIDASFLLEKLQQRGKLEGARSLLASVAESGRGAAQPFKN